MTKIFAFLKDYIINYWHFWSAVWALVLLSYAVASGKEGIVIALVGLVGSMFTATGVIHGWKDTVRTKNSGGAGTKLPVDGGFKPE